MKILHLHNWDVDIAAAKKIQLDFQEKIILQHLQQPIHFIAGADVSYSRKLNKSFSAVTVFKYSEMEIVEWVLKAISKYRIPDPIRQSHNAVNQLRLEFEGSRLNSA